MSLIKTQYVTVKPEWKGETCFILGCGPSLRGFDASCLRGKGRVIALNDSFYLAPWADILYFGDLKWWQSRREAIIRIFCGGDIYTLDNQIARVKAVHSTGKDGLEIDPSGVRNGSNSGFASINLAYHFGVKRIVLLGYDMKCDGEWMHWNKRQEPQKPIKFQQTLNMFNAYFPSLKAPLAHAGVEVINANPDSNLTVWPRVPLAEVLC